MDQMDHFMKMLAAILVLGVGAQWLAWRLRIPAILMLLTTGCVAGSFAEFISPDEMFGALLQPLVSLSVGLILFEGGLNLRLHELRKIWKPLLGLLTVGAAITWFGAALAAHFVLGIPASVSLVLGAVLTVTGPTVIGPLLREIRPSGQVGVIAKWESIAIDPIGATLAVLVFEAIASIRAAEYQSATLNAIQGFAGTAIAGAAVGGLAAKLLVESFRRFWIPDYLQNPMTLLYVVASFAGANMLHSEAGLVAVTVMGVLLANQRHVDVHRIIEFKESLTVLLIATLFIVLSSRVPLQDVADLGWRGPAFVLLLIFVVRPVSVWLSTLGTGLSRRERVFLSWFAPRGIVAAAVSSMFALRMGESGAVMAPATLVVILMTVAIYGLTAAPLARRLGLAASDPQGLLIAGASQMSRAIARALSKEGIRVVLVDTRYQRVAKAREAGLNVCFASILSEYVMNAVDFEGLGRFLAMTSNDQINTLAAARFRELFGAQNVMQLPRGEARQRLETTWQNRLAGRCLFGPKLTYEFIDSALDQGATIKTTRFSQVFTMEAFRAHYGDRVYPLFLVDGARVHVIAADSKFNPRAGQVVISLVVPETTTVTSGPSDSTVLSDSSVVTSDAIVSAPPGSAS
ncbi:MAG: sodium:proton antiporter [Planctomycetaceae bacterium]|nr:sodium:proton antiporter [Planctomycetaceae bacterium]